MKKFLILLFLVSCNKVEIDYKGYGDMFCQAVSMKPNKLSKYEILPEKRFDIFIVVRYHCEDGRVIELTHRSDL